MEAEKSVVAQTKGGEDAHPTIDKAYLVGWASCPLSTSATTQKHRKAGNVKQRKRLLQDVTA